MLCIYGYLTVTIEQVMSVLNVRTMADHSLVENILWYVLYWATMIITTISNLYKYYSDVTETYQFLIFCSFKLSKL